MSVWKKSLGDGARLEINRDAFSQLLFDHFQGELNDVAAEAASKAKSELPDPSMKKFISTKAVSTSPDGWEVEYKGGLRRNLKIPVALVTNDSFYAFVWEYGPIYSSMADEPSKSRLMKRYSPLTKAMAAVSRGRSIRKYRPIKKAGQP